MKFQLVTVAAALLAAVDATAPRRLRKGQVRRMQGEETGGDSIEVGVEAEDVIIKAKAMKSMSMRSADAKAGKIE